MIYYPSVQKENNEILDNVIVFLLIYTRYLEAYDFGCYIEYHSRACI